MTKEMYDKLVKWYEEQPTIYENLDVEKRGDLWDVLRKTVNEDNSECFAILHAYGCSCFGKRDRVERIIDLYIVGDVWRKSSIVQQVFNVQYHLDNLEEEYDENDDRRYDFVISITNCSEVE